jgi:[ribosomal protein S5]-alanine N-acetyltransferase
MNESVFNKFPVLEVDKYVLRELSVHDVKPFFAYLSDPLVNKYISDEDTPKSLPAAEDEIRYWADLFNYKRSIYWAIAEQKTNKIIGTCGFNVWSRTHSRTEVSYDLARAYWGKGIMTRCVRAICDYAFINMGVNRIQATVADDNFGSIRVLEKLGFQHEGKLRQYGILHGRSRDFYMMSLLNSDITF